MTEPLCGILPIDKPGTWTSHDVVAKLRGILGTRRVGHAGTLDPMATGLLIVLVGKATRLMDLMLGEKTYEARFRLGFESDTLDAEGNVRPTGMPVPSIEAVQAVLPQFMGHIEQIPPMVSAVKIDGRRLYDLARQGIEVERKPRPVVIRELCVSEAEDGGDLHLRMVCSSGTYVRSLIDDVGRALGCGAIMTALRRTSSGSYNIDQAIALEKTAARPPEELLLSLRSALPELPVVTLTEKAERELYQGKSCESDRQGLCWLERETHETIALGHAEQGRLKLHINFQG